MFDRQPNCVYVADSSALAEIIIKLLKGNGIIAQTIEPAKVGLSVNGVEIWVDEPAQAARARELIPQLVECLYQMLFNKPTEDPRAPDEAARRLEESPQFKAWKAKKIEFIPVNCMGCVKVTGFPASKAGTVQECPHCGEFLDVPELEPDQENEPQESDRIKKMEPDME